jgi:hypothetical protein
MDERTDRTGEEKKEMSKSAKFSLIRDSFTV